MSFVENKRIKRIDILVTTLCRPHLLMKLADSLSKQIDYDHLHIKTFLFADSVQTRDGNFIGSLADSDKCVQYFSECFPNSTIMRPSYNLGICGNFARINDHMLNSEADAFIFIEEDVMLRSDYITMTADLLDVTAQNPAIGLISGVPGIALTQDEQEASASELIPIGHKWSFALNHETARILCPMLKVYLDFCKSVNFYCNGRDGLKETGAVKAFLSRYSYPIPVEGTGPDAAIDIMSSKLGLHSICTKSSYGVSTGRNGLHFTDTQFEAMNLHQVTLFEGQRVRYSTSDVNKALHSSMQYHRNLLLESIS
ncbi:hypothetical protein [Methylobacterium sp. Gmos1]